ncbi:AcrR family transcriptional regulator [Actinoalloteichus hymeniacidonis]|nr:AcrR family transcriptional regulator [Actinoalloteichus hymeniacidonis]
MTTAPLKSITIGDIAKGAGISRPSLYFYFDSKAQVFCALLARTGYHRTPGFLLCAADSEQPVAGQVQSIVRQTFRTWRENTVVLRRGFEAADDLDVARQWQRTASDLTGLLAQWIARCRATGLLTVTDETPLELAESLLWLIEKSCYRLFSRATTLSEQNRRAVVLVELGRRMLGDDPVPAGAATGDTERPTR